MTRTAVGRMSHAVLCTFSVILFSTGIASAVARCPSQSAMCSRWTDAVSTQSPLPEYPRPQMVRQKWQSLNGSWRYAITGHDETKPEHYDGSILVPYPVESLLSGVNRTLEPTETLWYSRDFFPVGLTRQRRLLLHFGAIDFSATVYINDVEIGTHSGGYQSFTFDITEAVKPGLNNLVIKVFDPTETGINPRGKQTRHPGGIAYTGSSGIWQTVWLEVVPTTFIERVLTTPHLNSGEVAVNVEVSGGKSGDYVEALVLMRDRTVASGRIDGNTTLKIENPHPWSPDDPFLYSLRIRLLNSGRIVDEVTSYFGMRSVAVKADSAGISRIFLNGRYTYNLGVLDQGFWPDGLYTAPTDKALQSDVLALKAMGFNTIRKHIKIEPERWYYYCDKLGMLVWQDMVPPGKHTVEAQSEFEREAQQSLQQLHNHPSITTWVLFNEGWGSYDQQRLGDWIKSLDPSRLIDAHSGPNVTHVAEWSRELEGAKLVAAIRGDDAEGLKTVGLDHGHDWVGGNIVDIHSYPNPLLPPSVDEDARVIGEFGGIQFPVLGHVWNGIPAQGAHVIIDPALFANRYKQMIRELKALEAQGLSGSIYTQPFDVEREQNGLVTYDRAIAKIPIKDIASLNQELVSGSVASRHAAQAFTIDDVSGVPSARRYSTFLREYLQGNRGQEFLKRMTFLALELGDQTKASASGNQLIERASVPYSADTWRFIQAITRTSQDRGFKLLLSDSKHADEVLGPNAAEIIVRDIIGREEVTPHTTGDGNIHWPGIEETVSRKYGQLGAEEVYGAEMLYYIERADWQNFSKYFELYYSTAYERSEYPLGILSYLIFKHVSDARALESAITACRPRFDILFVCGQVDPPGIDTYANLLYKVGRTSEAIELEERALRFADGRSEMIPEHLSRMRAGLPTWPPR